MFDLPLKQNQRFILHVDADAFFASVEQVLNPKLKGGPLIVGGPTKSRGVVSACSYEARKFGIHSGMPMFKALKLCPNAQVVGGNFSAYRDFSRRMYQIFKTFSPFVEMLSIDEAYLDISNEVHGKEKNATKLAEEILFQINKELGISVSCGLASNKTVAKVASSTNKPHKLTVVPFGKERKFLSPLSLTALPGVGPKTFQCFRKYGLNKIDDFASLCLVDVIEKFGVSSLPLWKRAMGVDNSLVCYINESPKSMSKELTFYDSKNNKEVYLKTLRELSGIVFSKLRAHGMQASTLCVKIRYKIEDSSKSFFRDFSFQKHLAISSNADSDLFPEVKQLFVQNVSSHFPVRLIGVGVSNLNQNYNLRLFN